MRTSYNGSPLSSTTDTCQVSHPLSLPLLPILPSNGEQLTSFILFTLGGSNPIISTPLTIDRVDFWQVGRTCKSYSRRTEVTFGERHAHCQSTAIAARMSHWKWRETKQQPSRARSGHQIICCLVFLHFLCDILATITVQDALTHYNEIPIFKRNLTNNQDR